MSTTGEIDLIPARTRARIDVPIVAGSALFGFAAVISYIAAQFWRELGLQAGPPVFAVLAFLLFSIHLGLIFRRCNAMDPLIWIPVSMLFFYFGMPVSVDLLHDPYLPGYDAWQLGFSPNLGRGFCMALLTMVAFLWGGYLGGVKDLSAGAKRDLKPDESLVLPGMALLGGGLAMVAVGIAIVGPSTVFGLYANWWYAKTYGADPRLLDIGLIFAETGVFVLIASYNPRRPGRQRIAYAGALIIGTIMILKGDRSALIQLGVGAGWCYTHRVRNIRVLPLLVLGFLVMLVLPILKEFRDTRSIEETTHQNPLELVSALVYETGSTAEAFVRTLDLIPSTRDYDHGMSYVGAVIDAIPNFSLTPGKSFNLEVMEHEPSHWITATLAPDYYRSGGGFGYAMGAEWYFNFGMPGVLLGMVFYGYVTARIRNRTAESSFALVVSAIFFMMMVIYVRNSLGDPFRRGTWPIIGLAILSGAASLLRPKTSRTAVSEP